MFEYSLVYASRVLMDRDQERIASEYKEDLLTKLRLEKERVK